MILWTLFFCVLLAPSQVASESMEININCDVGNQNAHDWKGMAKGAYGLLEAIPEIGSIFSVGESLNDIWDAWDNVDDGFGKQWESCIQGWITTAIDDKAKAETKEYLKDMGVKMGTIMELTAGSGQVTNSAFGQINDNIHTLQDKADLIKDKTAGTNDPVAFLIAYDAALANELTIAYLFISKINQTMTDSENLESGYRSYILKDLGHTFSSRMVEYRKHLENMETSVLNSFFNDWKIKHTDGFGEYTMHTTWYLETYCDFHCNIWDPTSRLKGQDLDYSKKIMECDYQKQDECLKVCTDRWFLMENMVVNAQIKVHEILDGMKRTVEKAFKIFDDLDTKSMALTHGEDCNDQCLGSEYDIKCLTRCHSAAASA